jgi:hypothetical protein
MFKLLKKTGSSIYLYENKNGKNEGYSSEDEYFNLHSALVNLKQELSTIRRLIWT